jgi:cyanuric acid amidohydrolase
MLESVSDASGLTRLLDEGVVEADRVVASSARPRATAGSTTTRIIADRPS